MIVGEQRHEPLGAGPLLDGGLPRREPLGEVARVGGEAAADDGAIAVAVPRFDAEDLLQARELRRGRLGGGGHTPPSPPPPRGGKTRPEGALCRLQSGNAIIIEQRARRPRWRAPCDEPEPRESAGQESCSCDNAVRSAARASRTATT